MKKFIIALIFTAVLAANSAPAAEATATTDAAKAAITPADPVASAALLKQQPYDRVLGNERAPVTIVEYSSLSCPHCADFHEKTLPEIQKKYVDAGQVRFLVRPFPLNEPALMGAQLTYCVPKDKYYSFVKVLFSMQQKWAMTLDYKDNLKRIARVGGLSDAEYDTCMSNKKQQEDILAVRKTATDTLKIEATPTFFINGEKVQGDVPLEAITKVIDKQLAKK